MSRADFTARAQAGDAAAQRELAALDDADGRHTEALDWLARSARAGDAQALAQLGLKLLTGAHAPWRPNDAVGLLVDAANRGSGEAAEIVSVLAAGGFYGPQNWDVALDFLQRAAEFGRTSAQQQLRLLTGRPADGPDADWSRLRRSIDLTAWLHTPAAETRHETPRIRTVRGLLAPAVCAWVVAQAGPKLKQAEVHDPETGLTVMGATRTNRVANFALTETSLLNLLVQARIAAAAGAPIAMMEAFAVLNYRVGEEASEHYDYLDPAVPAYAGQIAELGQRVATCLLYLNDDYEGGETAFPRLGLSHKGRAGDALVFLSVDASGAPDPRSLHAGRPPISGEKWVLSQFIRNRARAGVAPG